MWGGLMHCHISLRPIEYRAEYHIVQAIQEFVVDKPQSQSYTLTGTT
jgi:hypothetical protein